MITFSCYLFLFTYFFFQSILFYDLYPFAFVRILLEHLFAPIDSCIFLSFCQFIWDLILTLCHMTILHYQFSYSINVFWPKNWFWTIFTKFVGKRMAATIKFVIPKFHSGLGWSFIAKSENKLIDASLS